MAVLGFVPLFIAALGVLATTRAVISMNGFIAAGVACAGTVLLLKITTVRRVATTAWVVLFVPVIAGYIAESHRAKGGSIDVSVKDRPSPNVVLVTIDTLRPDHLGFHGYSRDTSPSLDSLASKGIVFTHAYAPMPCTAPSHASIMTGKYPNNHGVLRNGWSLPGGIKTLAEAFRHKGYRTSAFVGVAHLSAAFGWARGFDYYADQGWYDQLFPYSGMRVVRTALKLLSVRFSRLAQQVIDDALDWLRDSSKEPFFMWIHVWDPHDPYAPPAMPSPEFFDPAAPSPKSAYAPQQIARWINGYDGEVRYVDEALERLWRSLRERRLAGHTAIVVVSDHGESLGERSYRGHSIFLYEEQVRVCCLFIDPSNRRESGRRVDQPVSLVDVAPTVLEIVHHDGALGGIDGESMLHLLDGSARRHPPVLLESNMWGFRADGLLRGDKKLIVHHHANAAHEGFARNADRSVFTTGVELFDLTHDPREETNLAAAHPETVTVLRTMMEKMRAGSAGMRGDSTITPSTVDALRELGYLD
jgi:arylsulfatase A-like enzyme